MRLDLYLYENGLVSSRTEAKNLILSGAVTVSGKLIKKPAYEITNQDIEVTVDKSAKKYVSRGGLKLEHALDKFNIDVSGALALDIGASSGGFTDCLLKRGVNHVIAVDSGSGQLNSLIASDSRVTSIENYNARYMKPQDFAYTPTLCVMDVSFISATLIIPAIFDVIAPNGDFVCLVKPQFEVGKQNVGKGGIVKDKRTRENALTSVLEFAKGVGFKLISHDLSPICGGDGNIEYLAYFKKI